MKRVLLCFFFVINLHAAATSTCTFGRQPVPQPTSVVTVGPGTVTSVRLLSLPFSVRYFVITYSTDDGKVIEVRHPGTLPVVEGMHGMMTYRSHPEMIVDFRVIQR